MTACRCSFCGKDAIDLEVIFAAPLDEAFICAKCLEVGALALTDYRARKCMDKMHPSDLEAA